jgi:serine/threonine-protein kinase RsbT
MLHTGAPDSETVPIRTPTDVVLVRQRVRALTTDLRFTMVDQTKMVTAASELARNTLDYGRGGWMRVELIRDGGKAGLRLHFEDEGPGIPDVERALQDGYTSGGGLGMGLPGSRRLVNEFEIQTRVGEGTRVTITRWK